MSAPISVLMCVHCVFKCNLKPQRLCLVWLWDPFPYRGFKSDVNNGMEFKVENLSSQQRFLFLCPTSILQLSMFQEALLFCRIHTMCHGFLSVCFLPLFLLFLDRSVWLQLLPQNPTVPLYTLLFSISQHPLRLDYSWKPCGQFYQAPCDALVLLWASLFMTSQNLIGRCTCIPTMASICTLW